MKESYSDIFHAVSYKEYNEIVRLYATLIVTIWNNFTAYVAHLNKLVDEEVLSIEEQQDHVKTALSAVKQELSNFLIEQYYNTGDENLFDAALMLNEKICLEEYSTIDLDAVRERKKPIQIFYQGVFLTLEDHGDSNRHHLKIIVRNEEEVDMINRKLNRSRQILEIDEVTLGKKYYDGLCQRSHFAR